MILSHIIVNPEKKQPLSSITRRNWSVRLKGIAVNIYSYRIFCIFYQYDGLMQKRHSVSASAMASISQRWVPGQTFSFMSLLPYKLIEWCLLILAYMDILWSEWVIKFNSLSPTADSEVHVVHIGYVIIANTLEPLSSLTKITHNLQATITLTPYMVLPLFATRFADYAGGHPSLFHIATSL